MSNYTGPRIPLHMQNPGIAKAKPSQKNPSYESFRPNEIHPQTYEQMEDRPSTHSMAWMRRYPNGQLDLQWALNTLLDAIKKAEYNDFLTPLEEALLNVIFPATYPMSPEGIADVRTQLSRSEKTTLRDMAEAQFKEELNYNAGRGGGSVEGRSRTLNGVG